MLINLKWNVVSGAASYNLKRGTANGGPYPAVFSGLTATNHSDAAVTNAVTYFYVVTAVSGGEERSLASQRRAPAFISTYQYSGAGQQWPVAIVLAARPSRRRLQIQTNDLSAGLGTNWTVVTGSTATNQIFIPINRTNGSVFLRLVYP